MELSENQLNEHNLALARKIGRLVGANDLSIAESSNTIVGRPSRISYRLVGRSVKFVERNRGERSTAVPFTDNALVGLHSEWDRKQGKYCLVGLSYSFFLRRNYDSFFPQLLRAEWDHVLCRGDGVAQPHWHIDSEVLFEIPTSPRSPPANEAEDLDSRSDTINEDVSGIHLGMGGWTQNAEDSPRCWQNAVSPEAVLRWTSALFTYMRQEFSRIP